MTTQQTGEAHLQRQIDDLKKRVDEMQDLIRDMIAQLTVKHLYRGR
jgi:chaperonin cofactor prefoldin